MKPLLIILALVGVMFIVILAVSTANDQPFDPDKDPPPGIVNLAGDLFGRWSPHVTFPQTTYSVAGGPVVIPVPAADKPDESHRRAMIRVAPPNCEIVAIAYDSIRGEGARETLDHQDWKGSKSDRCAGPVIALSKGGTLKITCPPGQVCAIELGS